MHRAYRSCILLSLCKLSISCSVSEHYAPSPFIAYSGLLAGSLLSDTDRPQLVRHHMIDHWCPLLLQSRPRMWSAAFAASAASLSCYHPLPSFHFGSWAVTTYSTAYSPALLGRPYYAIIKEVKKGQGGKCFSLISWRNLAPRHRQSSGFPIRINPQASSYKSLLPALFLAFCRLHFAYYIPKPLVPPARISFLPNEIALHPT